MKVDRCIELLKRVVLLVRWVPTTDFQRPLASHTVVTVREIVIDNKGAFWLASHAPRGAT